MAKAGTVPFSCYQTSLSIQEVVLRATGIFSAFSWNTENEPLTTSQQIKQPITSMHRSMMTTVNSLKALNLKMNLTQAKVINVDDVDDGTRASNYGGDGVPQFGS